MTRKKLVFMTVVTEIVLSLFYLLVLLYLRDPIAYYLYYVLFVMCIFIVNFIMQTCVVHIASLTRIDANSNDIMSVIEYVFQPVFIRYNSLKQSYYVESRLMWFGILLILLQLTSFHHIPDYSTTDLLIIYLPVGMASLALNRPDLQETMQ